MKEKVYLTQCQTYDKDKVIESVERVFNQIGGIEKLVNQGEKVLIKINLLLKRTPDGATTTHPSIVEEVVKQVQSAGGIPIIGDSPGGSYTKNRLKSIYETTGMIQVAANTGCQLNYDTSSRQISNNGVVSKSLQIISPVLDCDKIIAIGKLKTHAYMTATMAVKLCFGYIPGLIKADYHVRMPDPVDFGNLLVDIYESRKPDFNIIDAVYGMEGDGPSAGTPIKVGCLLSGVNGHAIDTVGAEIMSIPPLSIPTLKAAKDRKLFSGNIEDIELLGDNLETYIKNFIHPKLRTIDTVTNRVPKFLRKILGNLIQPKPVFDKELCKACGDCVRACPAKTIEIQGKCARVNLDNCIRCFCCHELCPHKAIEINKPIFSKILSK